MTVDEMNARLSQFGQQAVNLSDILTTIGSDITAEIKRAAPVDTGALRSSISFAVTPNSLEMEMLNYGIFQNYGVRGTEDDAGAKPTQTGFSGRFGTIPQGHIFQFKKRRFGLRPQNFFNTTDIVDEVVERLTEELTRPI